jgi:hypothetical protein
VGLSDAAWQVPEVSANVGENSSYEKTGNKRPLEHDEPPDASAPLASPAAAAAAPAAAAAAAAAPVAVEPRETHAVRVAVYYYIYIYILYNSNSILV